MAGDSQASRRVAGKGDEKKLNRNGVPKLVLEYSNSSSSSSSKESSRVLPQEPEWLTREWGKRDGQEPTTAPPSSQAMSPANLDESNRSLSKKESWLEETSNIVMDGTADDFLGDTEPDGGGYQGDEEKTALRHNVSVGEVGNMPDCIGTSLRSGDSEVFDDGSNLLSTMDQQEDEEIVEERLARKRDMKTVELNGMEGGSDSEVIEKIFQEKEEQGERYKNCIGNIIGADVAVGQIDNDGDGNDDVEMKKRKDNSMSWDGCGKSTEGIASTSTSHVSNTIPVPETVSNSSARASSSPGSWPSAPPPDSTFVGTVLFPFVPDEEVCCR
tara:strand:- start:299 stop:1282 length:984 start_codon:yes stop_codon:yes gene_type:complete